MPSCVVCACLFVVMFVWLCVRVCACGLNVCVCVMDCVMLHGYFLCVLVLCAVSNACVCFVCDLLCVVCVAAVPVCVCVRLNAFVRVV